MALIYFSNNRSDIASAVRPLGPKLKSSDQKDKRQQRKRFGYIQDAKSTTVEFKPSGANSGVLKVYTE